MDSKQQPIKQSEYHSYDAEEYTGYESDDAPEDPHQKARNTRKKRALERNLVLQEYEADRDAILQDIKLALRERRYKDAQEFVYTYRAAAKTDESFAALAEMTATGLEEERQIETLVTVFEATPEDDLTKRIEICEKILQIQPHNPKYLNELAKARQNLPAPVNAESSNVAKQPEPAISPACLTAFIILSLFNTGLCLAWVRTLPETLIILGSTLIQYWLLSNQRFSPLKKAPSFVKILINVWIWWLYIYFFMNIL